MPGTPITSVASKRLAALSVTLLVTATLGLAPLGGAAASFYDECRVLAAVTPLGSGKMAVEVIVPDLDSPTGGCALRPGDRHVVAEADLGGRSGQVELIVSYANGLTPTGVVESFDWRPAD